MQTKKGPGGLNHAAVLLHLDNTFEYAERVLIRLFLQFRLPRFDAPIDMLWGGGGRGGGGGVVLAAKPGLLRF